MSQFPPGSAPPPPPPPPPPGGGMPAPSGGSQPAEAGPAFSYAWAKFKDNWGEIIVAVLIGFAVVVVLEVIGFIIFGSITSSSSSCSGRIGDATFRCSNDGPGLIGTLFATAVLMMLIFIGQFVLQLIVIRASLLVIKGESFSTAQLLSMENIGPYAIASIIVAVMAGVGFIACILPGIAVLFFTHFYGYFVLDKNMAPMEAIKASFEMVKENASVVFIFYLLSFGVMILGELACGIGVIVAWPVVIIATGYMYKRLQGEPVAA